MQNYNSYKVVMRDHEGRRWSLITSSTTLLQERNVRRQLTLQYMPGVPTVPHIGKLLVFDKPYIIRAVNFAAAQFEDRMQQNKTALAAFEIWTAHSEEPTPLISVLPIDKLWELVNVRRFWTGRLNALLYTTPAPTGTLTASAVTLLEKVAVCAADRTPPSRCKRLFWRYTEIGVALGITHKWDVIIQGE